MSDRKVGIELIAAERQRQIDAEGWTPEHDLHHTDGELACAASVYALPLAYRTGTSRWTLLHRVWPEGWRYKEADRIHELAKAGALIAAEIDRLSWNETLT